MSDVEARLGILETRFEHCQVNIDKLMEDIKEDHREFKIALKDISVQLRNSSNDHANAVLEMRKEVLTTMDNIYERKAEIQKQLTDLRLSLIQDIERERSRTTHTLWAIMAVIAGSASFFGWLYLNILPHGGLPG